MTDSKIYDFDPRSAVYTPPEASEFALHAIQEVRENKQRGVDFPISEIGSYFAPLMPGQICGIIAQTSQYKSGFLRFWERALAEQLVREGRFNECIIHVSVEETVEEQMYAELAHYGKIPINKLVKGEVEDFDRLAELAVKTSTIPVYRIGDSIARAETMPNLYLSNIVRSIRMLVSGEITGTKLIPALVTWDYLQAFPIDPEIRRTGADKQRRLQVRSDVYRIKQITAFLGCPSIVNIQAKQNLDGAPSSDFLIPGMYDGEETSSIGQRFDRLLSLWMPSKTHMVGTPISFGQIAFTVQEYILWLKVLKQRGGLPSGKAWKCQIDFDGNSVCLAPYIQLNSYIQGDK